MRGWCAVVLLVVLVGSEAAADDRTVSVVIDCGSYRGLWYIPSAAAEANCGRAGQEQTQVTLTRGRRHAVLGAQRRKAFDIVVDANGTVRFDPSTAATLSGSTITLATVPVRIDSGPYTGGWRVFHAASRAKPSKGKTWCDEPIQTAHLLPGITYDLLVAYGPDRREWTPMSVHRDGTVRLLPWPVGGQLPLAPVRDAAGNLFCLSTVRVNVRAPAGIRWAVNGSNCRAAGDGSCYLVPGITYRFELHDGAGATHPYNVRLRRNTPLGTCSVASIRLPDGTQYEIQTFR